MFTTAKLVLANQLTVQLPTTTAFHYLLEWRSVDSSPSVPPTLTVLAHLLAYALIQEAAYYYVHRLLHASGPLYRAVHKVHHQQMAPVAISALYCHPAEHLLANVAPVLLGPLVMGSHRCTVVLWLLLAHFISLNDHSGYHFPGFPSPQFHDYHHLK